MAQIDHKLELLKRVPLFKDLSKHDIEQVGQLTEEVDVPAGQVLTREGAPGSEFFVALGESGELFNGSHYRSSTTQASVRVGHLMRF